MKIAWFSYNKYEWHKKFIWLPSVFRNEKDQYILVWLEFVKRKNFTSVTNKYVYSCYYKNSYYEKIKKL